MKEKIFLFFLILIIISIVLTRRSHSSNDLFPSEESIFRHIVILVEQGIRRPGYPADLWAEDYIIEQFKEFGLEDVHKEKVTHHGKDFLGEPEINLKWEPIRTSLIVYNDKQVINIPAFSVPFASSTDDAGLDLEIVMLESQETNMACKGKIVLYPVKFRDGTPHFLLKRTAEWYYDPEDTLKGRVAPVVSIERLETMDYAISSGAKGYIGIITNNLDPDLYEYYIPTFGKEKPIPGVYISEKSGAMIMRLMKEWPLRGKIVSKVSIEPFTSHNIIGTLKGRSDDWIVIGGHHDAGFYGAVEGGSSTALVLALAEYWAGISEDERPHNMLFMVTSGHICGVTGGWSFPREHKDFLKNIVLQISLQNIALEYKKIKGEFTSSHKSQPRIWFTTPSKILMDIVKNSIIKENIDRSYVFRPNVIDKKNRLPNSDGAFFYRQGVPIVNLVSSPAYLFTYADTLEKVDRKSLVHIMRAVIHIVNSLQNISAEDLRNDIIEDSVFQEKKNNSDVKEREYIRNRIWERIREKFQHR